MRIISGILLGGWSILFLMCLVKHPKSISESFSAAGAFLPKRFVRRHALKIPADKALALFPENEPEEATRAYIRFWWGLWYCGLILCGTLCLGVMWLDQQAIMETKPVSLERPAFGSEDTKVLLEMEAQDGNNAVKNKVQIRVPAKNPSEQEIESILDAAETQVQEYFHTTFLYRETWPNDLENVQITCIPEEEQWIDAQGKIQWKQITTSLDTQIRVLLTAYGKERESWLALHIDPKTETLEEKADHVLDRVEQGEYVTENAVELPTVDETGVRYSWNPVERQKQTEPWVYGVWIGLLPFVPILLYRYKIRQKTIERRKKVYRSYPDMLNQFMILLGAGMSIMRAWEKMDTDYRGKKKRDHIQDPLYEEMLRAENRMRTGYSFAEAVRLMAETLKVREIRQFASILAASWKRGDAHVLVHLKDLHDRSWEIRKNQARKASEEADTKLLLPLMMMLIVVIIIVLSPALMTMTV